MDLKLAHTSPTNQWPVRKFDYSLQHNSDVSNRWRYTASHLARAN